MIEKQFCILLSKLIKNSSTQLRHRARQSWLLLVKGGESILAYMFRFIGLINYQKLSPQGRRLDLEVLRGQTMVSLALGPEKNYSPCFCLESKFLNISDF